MWRQSMTASAWGFNLLNLKHESNNALLTYLPLMMNLAQLDFKGLRPTASAARSGAGRLQPGLGGSWRNGWVTLSLSKNTRVKGMPSSSTSIGYSSFETNHVSWGQNYVCRLYSFQIRQPPIVFQGFWHDLGRYRFSGFRQFLGYRSVAVCDMYLRGIVFWQSPIVFQRKAKTLPWNALSWCRLP